LNLLWQFVCCPASAQQTVPFAAPPPTLPVGEGPNLFPLCHLASWQNITYPPPLFLHSFRRGFSICLQCQLKGYRRQEHFITCP
jgi:hypothetical protein